MNSAQIKSLTKEAIKTQQKKPVKLVKEPVTMADGSSFQPIPVKSASDVLNASLLMLFKHVADMHVTVVEIVADKFGLQIEEIHSALTKDPRWQTMLSDPFVVDMTASAKAQAAPAKKRGRPRKIKAHTPPIVKPKNSIVISDEEELVFETD